MRGQLTNAGVAALQGSALVTIPLAKLGDGVNYIPQITDTDIHGNEVWRTTPGGPLATNANTVRWSVFMDVNVGPFQFGEVGLYLPNGDLFALFAADELIDKINVGGANEANEVNLLIFVTMVGDNYVIWLDLASTNNQLQVARANSPDQLPQPQNAYPNIYIMPGATPEQQSILAVTDRQGLWAFCGYDNANTMHGTIVGFDSNSITIDAAQYTDDMSPDYFGQLILQFTTGNLYGICRYIKQANQSGTTWRLTFNTPLAMTPVVGDTFSIQSRNPLTIDGGNLPVATRSSAGVVIPLPSLTLDGTGRIGVDWTKLSINGTAATQTGDNGELTLTISTVGRTGQYSDLLNIPPLFAPVLATPTVRGGVKIAPGTGLYLDANEVLQIDTSGIIPDVIGLVSPQEIPASTDLNGITYQSPGLFWTSDSTGLVNAPLLPAAAATLEVVPISAGNAPGAVVQRWTQTNGGVATRVFNGTTWSAWVVAASIIAATKTSLGMVQIGTNLSVTPQGIVDVPIATQTTVGVVKGSTRVVIGPDGTMDVPGVLTQADVGIPGGVAGPLSTDPDSPPPDQDVSDYLYNRVPPEQMPLGFLNSFANWDAGTNIATYTDESLNVHTVNLVATGQMTDSWNDGTAHSITVTANGKIFYVTAAGTTALDGVTSWAIGDLAVALGQTWVKISNSSGGGVSSLNTLTGALILAGASGISVSPSGSTLTFSANLQQTVNDTTAGRILNVGNAFGLGADNILDQRDLNDAQVQATGFYGQAVSANATLARNYPVAGLVGTLIVVVATAGTVTQLYLGIDGSIYTRTLSSTIWSTWQSYISSLSAPVNSFAAAKILAIADGNTYWRFTSATGAAVTAPPNATTAIPIGMEFHFRQAAAGAITFTPGAGVTINAPTGGSLVSGGLGSTLTLKKVGTNEWDLFGVTA